MTTKRARCDAFLLVATPLPPRTTPHPLYGLQNKKRVDSSTAGCDDVGKGAWLFSAASAVWLTWHFHGQVSFVLLRASVPVASFLLA